MHFSKTFFKGGSGRALCRPTRVGTTDGPFRHKRFHLKPIRSDFENVLMFGNTKKLVNVANSVINSPDKHFSENFWKVFKERIYESTHIIDPQSFSVILRAISHNDLNNSNKFIYENLALSLPRKINELDGKSFYEILKHSCYYLKFTKFSLFYLNLKNHLPNILYSLSVDKIIEVLNSFKIAEYIDTTVCELVHDKIEAQIANQSPSTIAHLASIFADYNYRSISIFKKISELAIKMQFEASDLDLLISSFAKLKLENQLSNIKAAS